MFLELVTPNRTEVPEVDGSSDPIDLLAVVGPFGFVRVLTGVNGPRPSVEPVGDWTWEEYGDDQTDEHLDSEENEAEKQC